MCVKAIIKSIGGLIGLGGDAPTPAPLPVPPEAPKDVDPSVQRARTDARKRAQAAKGFSSTLIGGASPLADPLLSRTTLIGSGGDLTL